MTGPRERVARQTAALPIYISTAEPTRRAVVLEKHLAEPCEIDWAGLEAELTAVIDLRNDGRVGSLTIRGLHVAPTQIVTVDLPDEVLVTDGYIDLPIIRSFNRSEVLSHG